MLQPESDQLSASHSSQRSSAPLGSLRTVLWCFHWGRTWASILPIRKVVIYVKNFISVAFSLFLYSESAHYLLWEPSQRPLCHHSSRFTGTQSAGKSLYVRFPSFTEKCWHFFVSFFCFNKGFEFPLLWWWPVVTSCFSHFLLDKVHNLASWLSCGHAEGCVSGRSCSGKTSHS